MGKFTEEFYSSQIDEWKDYYLKYNQLKDIIHNIEQEIGKNNISQFKDDLLNQESNLEKPNNLEDSYFLKIIENNYPELDKLPYPSYIRNFIYELEKQVHSIYLFYLNIEREIFLKINSKLYLNKKQNKNEEEIIFEINELIEIGYLIYSFYIFTNSNIEAINKILSKFDKHLETYFKISLNSLYLKNNLLKENSDLKYMLLFKIIIESSAVLENFTRDYKKLYPNNSKILNKNKELLEIIDFINEKNTNLISNSIFETYIINKNTSLMKNKSNLKHFIHNSFLLSNKCQDDNMYYKIEEKEFDKEINISMTIRNEINVFICLFHTFFSSFYFIIPYINFVYYYNGKKNNFGYLGLILSISHLGNFFSNLFFIQNFKFKNSLILSCVLFLISMACYIFGDISYESNFVVSLIFFCFGKLVYGLGYGKVINRKYMLLYLPESKIQKYSFIYITFNHLGFFFGTLSNFFLKDPIKIYGAEFPNSLTFIVGFFIFLIFIIIILVLFTEPSSSDNSLPMLNRLSNNFLNEEGNMNDNEKLLTKNQIKEYNSLEEEIVNLHNTSKFNDSNLMSETIEKLKKKKFNNSRTFWKGFGIIFSSLLIIKIISEYYLILSLFYLRNKDSMVLDFSLFILSFFPYELFIRIIFNFSQERRAIIIFNIILLFTLLLSLVFEAIEYKSDVIFILTGCLKIIICSSIEGIIYILIEKLFHSFVKIASMNIKHWFSFANLMGKFLGAFIYIFLFLIHDEIRYVMIIVPSFFFCYILSLVILLFKFYSSLKVRAINKLIFIN